MKITRIQADNLLGVQHIDIALPTPITLFAGKNGAGKSSLQEAVRMAITQDHVRDVKLKKDLGKLVLEGQAAGGAVVTIDNDTDQSFAFNLPKGDFSGPEISEAMRVALLGQRFARMTPDERRTFLFGLMKIKASAATVKPRMLERGCEEAKVDAVLPLLRTGFPSVCEHAKGKATEAKGAWRQLTGETYGGTKAESWEAPLPEAPKGDAAALTEQVAALDANLAKLNESLGAIKNTARQAQDAAAKRAALSDAAAKVPGLTEQLELAKKDLAEYAPKVEALRQRASGSARVGLVHDMARFIDQLRPDTKELANTQSQLLAAYTKEHGMLGSVAEPEAVASLAEHERGLEVLQNRTRNLERDLTAATQAKAQYDALAPAAEVVDASAEIAEVENMIAQVKADRQAAENKRLDIEAAAKRRGEALKKTEQAKQHHADVLAWTKVADALAPEGIPNELLMEALQPVNDALAQAAVDSDWLLALIGSDMSLSANGRPYHLLSESEQWRVDAMIAQVVAELSGIKILMLDRVDVLDLPGRAQLLEWLDNLAFNNVIDTALLFGTFKQLPTGLADTITCHWIEGGLITASTTVDGGTQKAA